MNNSTTCIDNKIGRIIKSQLPSQSVLKNQGTTYDYIDSFEGTYLGNGKLIEATEVGKLFFSSSPIWVEHLFAFRNKIVGILGLKTSGHLPNKRQQLEQFRCEPGEQLGLFKVYEKTAQEVVLGEDDKHLDFRVSLFLQQTTQAPTQNTLTITTTVKFHNWLGKLYFLPVRPFHRLIVPSILKQILNKLGNTPKVKITPP